ncbi:group II intron reverse transcriptase/maturase [Xenorhabdus vietnamensis]|uniref:Group II intron reverse transcriptase/maturase n=1 Tax=Xenorhabdus vietnamensis TaxID=351656 RepID=A0A1Y2S9T4_9GAMM|nr:reverse transcriptase domain-containing protein [Xenorhabdus vietnamensis]OTA14259.1 group II intron reverse transcriptase/maturase [Xenorhabdus vietnamensis]
MANRVGVHAGWNGADKDKGTPQGGVISPLLTNLFLHYAFDMWMKREFPVIRFERYADDIVIHCKSHAQAMMLRSKLRKRPLSVSWR